jgi:hypothetical protein
VWGLKNKIKVRFIRLDPFKHVQPIHIGIEWIASSFEAGALSLKPHNGLWISEHSGIGRAKSSCNAITIKTKTEGLLVIMLRYRAGRPIVRPHTLNHQGQNDAQADNGSLASQTDTNGPSRSRRNVG